MRGLFVALALCCAATPVMGQTGAAAVPPTAPLKPSSIEPARLEKARTLIALVLPPEKRKEMFVKVIDAMMGNMLAGIMNAEPSLRDELGKDAQLRGIFSSFVARQRGLVLEDLNETTPALMMAYTNAYARTFSEGEMDDIIAFLSTPSGRKYADRSADLYSDPDVGAWQQSISARAQARRKPELKKFLDEVTSYLRSKGTSSNGS